MTLPSGHNLLDLLYLAIYYTTLNTSPYVIRNPFLVNALINIGIPIDAANVPKNPPSCSFDNFICSGEP